MIFSNKFVKPLLFLISLVFKTVALFRIHADKKAWINANRVKAPFISVGNQTVGGTGKTPMVEYLIRLLKDETNLATLSRGYGRKTKGCYVFSNYRVLFCYVYNT